jgi:hypothetical protein
MEHKQRQALATTARLSFRRHPGHVWLLWRHPPRKKNAENKSEPEYGDLLPSQPQLKFLERPVDMRHIHLETVHARDKMGSRIIRHGRAFAVH